MAPDLEVAEGREERAGLAVRRRRDAPEHDQLAMKQEYILKNSNYNSMRKYIYCQRITIEAEGQNGLVRFEKICRKDNIAMR